MIIRYGTSVKESIDVTDICLSKLTNNNIITIPISESSREKVFTDPFHLKLKKIFILNEDSITECPWNTQLKIDIKNNTIQFISNTDITEKLKNIQTKLQLNHGYFWQEYPEQLMTTRYLTGSEKVLEIGANIGRNSLIIASILQDSRNLVSLESCPTYALQLIENRDINNLHFFVEPSALSKTTLIQKDWNTIPSDTLKDGYSWVNTITLDQLNAKYNIEFDTLILDCEAAFYYILMDMPEILNNIKLIIMENDYNEISKKKYIDDVLVKHNFYPIYSENGGWGPCYNFFYEAWTRNI